MAEQKFKGLDELGAEFKMSDIDVYKSQRDKAYREVEQKMGNVIDTYRQAKSEALYNRDLAMKFLEEKTRNSRFLNLGRELSAIQNAYMSARTTADQAFEKQKSVLSDAYNNITRTYDLNETLWKYGMKQRGGKSRRQYIYENREKLGDKFAELLTQATKQDMKDLTNEVLKQTNDYDNKENWNNAIDEMAAKYGIDDELKKELKAKWEIYQKLNYELTTNHKGEWERLENKEQFDENSKFYKSRDGSVVLGETKSEIVKGDLYNELREKQKANDLLDERVFGHNGAFYVSKEKNGTRVFKRLEIANRVDKLVAEQQDSTGKILNKDKANYSLDNVSDTAKTGNSTSGLFTIGGYKYKTKEKPMRDLKSSRVAGNTPYGSTLNKFKSIYEGLKNESDNIDKMKSLLSKRLDSGDFDKATQKRFKTALKDLNNGRITNYALQQYIQASRSGDFSNAVGKGTQIVGRANGKWWTIMDGKLYELERA